MQLEQLIVQYGVAGAVLAAIAFFLKALGDERKDRAEERAATMKERERFLSVLEDYRSTFDLVVERCTGERHKV